jgi:hypothetical protein
LAHLVGNFAAFSVDLTGCGLLSCGCSEDRQQSLTKSLQKLAFSNRAEYKMATHRMTRANPLIFLIIVLCFALILLERTDLLPPLRAITIQLYQWSIVLAAFALLLGVANVLLLHFRRLYGGRPGWGDSLALITVLLAVLVAGLFHPLGATSPVVEWFFDSLVAPGQATLFALSAFFMVAAAYRYLRLGSLGGAWMLLGVLLTVVVQMPIGADWLPAPVQQTVDWLLTQPVMATLRGALLGGSLALLITGVRFLVVRGEIS